VEINNKLPSLEMAREWYQNTDSVHNFEHIERVYRLAIYLADCEGANARIVGAAALFHDVEGSDPTSLDRKEHHQYSARFARQILEKEGWQEEEILAVQHCIRAHRFRDDREPPRTIEAKVLFDADKLDAIGAVGVARAIAHSTLTGAPLFCEPSSIFRETGELSNGENHSTYHEYIFKLSKIINRLFTASGLREAASRDQFMCAYFEQLKKEMDTGQSQNSGHPS
jgi:uncharacterized protein